MRTKALLLTAVLLGLLAVPASGSTDPSGDTQAVTFQVTTTHTGRSLDQFSPPVALRWTRHLGGPVSYPLVAAGRVFVLVSGVPTQLHAFDLDSGRRLWYRTVGPQRSAVIAYGDNLVFVVTEDCTVLALDPATGGTRWAADLVEVPTCVAPPVVRHHLLLVQGGGSGAGSLFAFQTDSGVRAWKVRTGSAAYAPPIASAKRIFVNGAQDASSFRYDGTEVWSAPVHGCCDASAPGVAGALYRGRLYARYGGDVLDAATGEHIADLSSEAPYAFDRQSVLRNQAGTLEAVDIVSGAKQWSLRQESPFVTAPLVANGAGYVGTRAGFLVAVRLADGVVVWQTDVPGRFRRAEGDSRPMRALSAAQGALIIPAGPHLTVLAP